MKKEAKEIAKYYGCTTHYSGKTKTMFVRGDNHAEAIIAIKSLTSRFDVKDGYGIWSTH